MKQPQGSEKYKSFIRRNYVLLGLIASLIYGISDFIVSFISSKDYTAIEYIGILASGGIFMLVYCTLFHLVSAFYQKKHSGLYWSKSASAYFKSNKPQIPDSASAGTYFQTQYSTISYLDMNQDIEMEETFLLNWNAITCVTIKAILYTLGAALFWLASYTSYQAGINFAVISTITGISPFLVAILFYYSFNEKLNRVHFMGIILMTLCIVLNCIAAINTEGVFISDSTIEDRVIGLMSIICVIGSSCFYVLSSWAVRYYAPKVKMETKQFQTDSMAISALLLLTFALFFAPAFEIGWFLFANLSQLLQVCGFGILTETLIYGVGGPAQSIAEAASLWLLLLNMIFLKLYPNYLQIVAFVVGMIGAFSIMFCE